MTTARAEAMSIVKEFPEEHIAILAQNLRYMRKMYVIKEEVNDNEELKKSTQAVEALQKYHDEDIARSKEACKRFLSNAKPGIGSGDYKKDLLEMLEKKYESTY